MAPRPGGSVRKRSGRLAGLGAAHSFNMGYSERCAAPDTGRRTDRMTE